MTHDLTDKGMRILLAEELRREGHEGLARDCEYDSEVCIGSSKAALAAMTRIRDAAYEEAAKVADRTNCRELIAVRIRSLSKPLEKENG